MLSMPVCAILKFKILIRVRALEYLHRNMPCHDKKIILFLHALKVALCVVSYGSSSAVAGDINNLFI